MFGIVYWESYFFASLNLNFIAVLGTDCSDFLAFVIVHVDFLETSLSFIPTCIGDEMSIGMTFIMFGINITSMELLLSSDH